MARSASLYTRIRPGAVPSTWCRDSLLYAMYFFHIVSHGRPKSFDMGIFGTYTHITARMVLPNLLVYG